MRGTFVFTVGGAAAYGVVVVTDHEVRLGVRSAEWEPLAVAEGQTVRLDVPGVIADDLLVAAVSRLKTGNTWVSLRPPVRRRLAS